MLMPAVGTGVAMVHSDFPWLRPNATDSKNGPNDSFFGEQMPRESLRIGDCPKCNGNFLACTYNHFGKDDLTIDSWEHKCPDCGFRETTAFRSDEDDWKEEKVDPRVCPYCDRKPQTTN